MSQDLQRGLAQIFISKYGGNVGHTNFTILLELIDNSLDANATQINIKTLIIGNSKYLTFYDNGDGIEHIKNILLAQHSKLNKIGSKKSRIFRFIAKTFKYG